MTLAAYAKALGIGVSAGLRTFAAPAIVNGSGGSRWTPLLAVGAAGECCADKLPNAPSRLEPLGIGARIVTGGWSGGELAARAGGLRTAGVVIGALGAVGGAFAGYSIRSALVERGLPAFPVALAEDAIAILGAFACC